MKARTLLERSSIKPPTNPQGRVSAHQKVARKNRDAIADLTYGECTTVTPDMIPLASDDGAIGDEALRGWFSMAVRSYVKPGSERGPDPQLQLRPHALIFSHD